MATLQTREWSQRMIAALSPGDLEYALVDSGSGVVPCPRDYAPDVPIEPVGRDPGPLVSVIDEPVTCIGTKTVDYILPHGEEMIPYGMSRMSTAGPSIVTGLTASPAVECLMYISAQ